MILANSTTSIPIFSRDHASARRRCDEALQQPCRNHFRDRADGGKHQRCDNHGIPADKPTIAQACDNQHGGEHGKLTFSSFSQIDQRFKATAFAGHSRCRSVQNGRDIAEHGSQNPGTAQIAENPPIIIAAKPPTRPANSMCFFMTRSTMMTASGTRLKTNCIFPSSLWNGYEVQTSVLEGAPCPSDRGMGHSTIVQR